MSRRQRPGRRQLARNNTYRFFVHPDAVRGRDVLIDDDDLAHQISHVLRLAPGDQVLLLDNSGWQYTVSLSGVDRQHVMGTVERKELASGEPRTKITLYTALMRAERFEWVLQKGTELGVAAFVPVIGERSTLADADELSERKMERWGRIVREAAEQSRRGKLPRLTPVLFWGAACEQASRRGPALLLWEGEGAAPLRAALRGLAGAQDQDAPPATRDGDAMASARLALPQTPLSVAVFSGPEGGLTRGELETARDHGITPVTLGPRILRAETAPLVAATALLYELGDLE